MRVGRAHSAARVSRLFGEVHIMERGAQHGKWCAAPPDITAQLAVPPLTHESGDKRAMSGDSERHATCIARFSETRGNPSMKWEKPSVLSLLSVGTRVRKNFGLRPLCDATLTAWSCMCWLLRDDLPAGREQTKFVCLNKRFAAPH